MSHKKNRRANSAPKTSPATPSQHPSQDQFSRLNAQGRSSL